MNGLTAYVAVLATVGLVACSDSKSDPTPQKTIVLQGFEVDTGDWEASQGITRVASGGGTLQLTASSGGYYAELENLANGYQDPGYGDGGVSRFGGRGTVYNGDFYQSIDVYVDASWAPAAVAVVDSFWIDMTPHHEDPLNYGAEHNFRLRATSSEVEVRVDGQTTPIASITADGWYTFLMTWEKAAAADDPVITDMVVLDSQNTVLGTTTVYATSPGGPFTSQDLRGNGYVWITVWQNGFAGDVLGIDNVETALLPY
jgi:hypothetical protein